MKNTRTMPRTLRLLLTLVLVALTAVACLVTASAEDLEWNLLTDVDAGYQALNAHGVFEEVYEEDGTIYVHNTAVNRGGAYYIYDDNNILGTYRSFSLEGDFYFESLPSGTRKDGDLVRTPKEAKLSFLCWGYKSVETGQTSVFNALRIDDEGRLTLPDGKNSKETNIYLKTGKWYNIRILMMPENGMCELYVNGEKVEDFNIVRFDSKIHMSDFVRYFDGYYNWGVKMKNLIVKTDSSYVVGMREEEAADYIGYQTSKPEGDTFSVRTILGVNSTDYNRIGYEVIRLEKDYDGNVISEAISQKAKIVYESIKDANGTVYNVLEKFGYNYAAAIEIPDLPVVMDYDAIEIVVRPYVLGMDGIRLYGDSTILLYSGDKDENGYPVLNKMTERFATVTPTDDTFIYAGNSYGNEVFGNNARLQFRNKDESNKAPEVASYFKFHFTPAQVKMLETAASAKLCLYTVLPADSDMVLHGTTTDWDEMTLTYNNHVQFAKAIEYITQTPTEGAQYIYFDVLQYLNEQMLNEDGSLTVSFRATNDGTADAFMNYIEAKEKSKETMPKIEIVTTIYDVESNLSKISNIGYEPWGYAEHLVDEWFDELVDKVYPKDANGNVIEHEVNEDVPDGYGLAQAAGDFTTVVDWQADHYIWVHPNYWGDHPGGVKREDEWAKERFARTLSTLGTSTANAYLSSEYAQTKTEYDVYGGIANAGFKGEATGFFHTEIYNGRTYIIDPLGNPYFAVGIDDFTMYNETWALEKYGTEEAYYAETTKQLKEMGINTAHVSQKDQLLAVEDGLSVVVDLNVVNAYMFSIGRSQVAEGQFPHNNTINVFDPDFIKLTNKNVTEAITSKGYAENSHVFGYTTDNELPGGDDILTRYLTVDPTEPTNAFSYAVAWTWLARKMDTPAPTLDEYLAHPDLLKMNSEFLSFIYTTYYGVARDAIESVDPNHMYIGSRVAGSCRFDEGYLRAAGYQLDMITTNLYTGLHFSWDSLINYYRYAGKPFLITEFYAKSMDAIDDNGFTMANSTGAGDVVKTQQERADYYEHQTMILLESKACVGWTWYCMIDNDQPLHRSVNLKKDVVMAYVSYGQYPEAQSFMDKEGNIYSKDQVGKFDTIDPGNAMMSNHNCNKGVFNRNYTSTVAVYSYDANGKLLGSKSYWVQHPDSDTPADGTVLTSLDGAESFKIGKAVNADGTYTVTALTTYEGTYVALAKSMRNISDNLMGLINYFDAN